MQNRYSLANEISYFKFDSVVAAQNTYKIILIIIIINIKDLYTGI